MSRLTVKSVKESLPEGVLFRGKPGRYFIQVVDDRNNLIATYTGKNLKEVTANYRHAEKTGLLWASCEIHRTDVISNFGYCPVIKGFNDDLEHYYEKSQWHAMAEAQSKGIEFTYVFF